MRFLRQYIRQVLLEDAHDRDDQDTLGKEEESEEDLLMEPDASKERARDEASPDEVNAISTGGGAMQSTGNISGVTTPLGTGPTYPVGRKKKKKKKSEEGDEDWYKTSK